MSKADINYEMTLAAKKVEFCKDEAEPETALSMHTR